MTATETSADRAKAELWDCLCRAASSDCPIAEEAASIVDLIVEAAVEAVESRKAKPQPDADAPRRFQVIESGEYGVYFPKTNKTVYDSGENHRRKPDWPVEWLDTPPEET